MYKVVYCRTFSQYFFVEMHTARWQICLVKCSICCCLLF